jgi:hypothetical protein
MKAAAALAFGIAVLTLAGCEDGRPAENRTRIKVENPHHDQLAALSEPMQRLGIMRAIRDSGRRCTRVEATAHQQEYRGMEMWVALCDDGRNWAVFIAPNGDVQTRNCGEHAQLDLPQCRPLAPAVPEADGNGVTF